VPQPQAAEQRVVGVDQPLVAAPVDLERAPHAGVAGRREVGVHVGTAKRVHRLLRVADQHQPAARAAERLAHDVPLVGVGVLELVDEHDAVAAPQARGDDVAARGAQRRLEPGQQVVEREDRGAALARLDLLADALRQPAPQPRGAQVGDDLGDRCARVADGEGRDLRGLAARQLRRVLGEPADVKVVDDLRGQVARVVEEAELAIEVAHDAEAAQDLLAEPVRRRDRRGVEVGQRSAQPVEPLVHLRGTPLGEQRQQPVGARLAVASAHRGQVALRAL
jgi:hypothetical protein